MQTTVRAALSADRDAWLALWGDYCRFYRAVLPDAVTQATWARILDPASPVAALVAEREGGVVGFANYVVHPYTWSERPACYLEDLYVREDARGVGLGAALIRALIDAAPREGWGRSTG
jgi:GNAT superfamily N-acetyltransferase